MVESIVILTILITVTVLYLLARVYTAKKANERVYLARGYALVIIKTKEGKTYKGYVPRITIRNLRKVGLTTNLEVEGIRGRTSTIIKGEDIVEIKQLKPPV